MNYPYIIIDDNQESMLKTRAMASGFHKLTHVGSATTYEEGVDLILEHHPKLVFLEISPNNPQSNLSLHLINELYRYLHEIPKIIVTTTKSELALEAIKYEVADYLMKPLQIGDFRKAILKLMRNDVEEQVLAQPSAQHTMQPVIVQPIEPEVVPPAISDSSLSKGISDPEIVEVPVQEIAEEWKVVEPVAVPEAVIEERVVPEDVAEPVEDEGIENEEPAIVETAEPPIVETAKPEVITQTIVAKEEKPLIICVKSYGDYRFINAKDIAYMEADNNSTDIHINNGEIITAFKTLKHFETVLVLPFVRIHNSYIVNVDYVSRIHTGNSVCYIKDTTIKLPFSKTYKDNIDLILNTITEGNYLET